jgi:hypothetical protein
MLREMWAVMKQNSAILGDAKTHSPKWGDNNVGRRTSAKQRRCYLCVLANRADVLLSKSPANPKRQSKKRHREHNPCCLQGSLLVDHG